jgi:hypothetical protein
VQVTTKILEGNPKDAHRRRSAGMGGRPDCARIARIRPASSYGPWIRCRRRRRQRTMFGPGRT